MKQTVEKEERAPNDCIKSKQEKMLADMCREEVIKIDGTKDSYRNGRINHYMHSNQIT